MEELLREVFKLGQQWTHEITYLPNSNPTTFNEWFKSDEGKIKMKEMLIEYEKNCYRDEFSNGKDFIDIDIENYLIKIIK